MINIKNLTHQSNESSDSSEIEIYKKRGKYIDSEILLNNINLRKYIIIISAVFLCYSLYIQNMKMMITGFLVLSLGLYLYTKGIFFRKGFYMGYDCGYDDASHDGFLYPGVEEAVAKNMGIK